MQHVDPRSQHRDPAPDGSTVEDMFERLPTTRDTTRPGETGLWTGIRPSTGRSPGAPAAGKSPGKRHCRRLGAGPSGGLSCLQGSGRPHAGMLTGGIVLAVLLSAPGMSSAKPKPITPTPQISGPAAFVASRTATLSFTDSRTDATFTCRLDAAPARACTSPVTYQNLAEGSHTFRVRAKSPTLRQSNEASLTWTVDVDAAGPADGDVPVEPDVVGDGDRALQQHVQRCRPLPVQPRRWRGRPRARARSRSRPPLRGLHTYAVTAVDRAGNASTAGTGFWYRDSLTPVPVVNDGPSDPTTATGATFTFASSEGGVSFGCSLDGSPFTACTTGKVYSSLGLGTHTFKVRATDSNGNTADSATYTWHMVATLAVNLDWANPAGACRRPTPPPRPARSPTRRRARPRWPARWTRPRSPAAAPAVLRPSSGLANGAHTFTVTADAGLPNQIVLHHGWTVDTVAPRAPVVLGPSGLVASTSATLTVLPSALGDAVSCTLDGAAASCTSPVALTGLGQGTHTYRVTESDLAGNTAATSISWTVDTTPRS